MSSTSLPNDPSDPDMKDNVSVASHSSGSTISASTHGSAEPRPVPAEVPVRRRRRAALALTAVLGVATVVTVIGLTLGLVGDGHWGGCGDYPQSSSLRGSNHTTTETTQAPEDLDDAADTILVTTEGPPDEPQPVDIYYDDDILINPLTNLPVEVIPGKKSWPEWVGHNALQARPVIMGENPNITVVLFYTIGMPLLQDYREERVRIAVYNHTAHANMTIAREPKVG